MTPQPLTDLLASNSIQQLDGVVNEWREELFIECIVLQRINQVTCTGVVPHAPVWYHMRSKFVA